MDITHSILLYVSMTINICTLVQLVINALLRRTISVTKPGNECTKKPQDNLINKRTVDMSSWIARKCSNQMTTLVLCCGAVYILASTSVLSSPFKMPESSSENNWRTIVMVFAVHVGRYIYRIISLFATRRGSSDVKSILPTCLTHTVTLTCYITIIVTAENVLLGVVGLVTEMTSAFNLYHTAKEWSDQKLTLSSLSSPVLLVSTDSGSGNRFRLICLITELLLTILIKVFFPVILLSVSAQASSPLRMTFFSITMFFLMLAYYTGTCCWKALCLIKALLDHLTITKRPTRQRTFERRACPGLIPMDPDLLMGLPGVTAKTTKEFSGELQLVGKITICSEQVGSELKKNNMGNSCHEKSQDGNSSRRYDSGDTKKRSNHKSHKNSHNATFKDRFENCRLEIIPEEK